MLLESSVIDEQYATMVQSEKIKILELKLIHKKLANLLHCHIRQQKWIAHRVTNSHGKFEAPQLAFVVRSLKFPEESIAFEEQGLNTSERHDRDMANNTKDTNSRKLAS